MKQESKAATIIPFPGGTKSRRICRNCAFPDPGIYNTAGEYFCTVQRRYIHLEDEACSDFLYTRFQKKL